MEKKLLINNFIIQHFHEWIDYSAWNLGTPEAVLKIPDQ